MLTNLMPDLTLKQSQKAARKWPITVWKHNEEIILCHVSGFEADYLAGRSSCRRNALCPVCW